MKKNNYLFKRTVKIDWLSEIPNHWEEVRLGSLFNERKTKVSDTEHAPLSVTKNGIVPQLENAAKSNDGDNRKLVLKGDFVINSRSDRKGSSGLSIFNGSVSLINIVLKPIENISPFFFEYLLKSYFFKEEYYRYGRGIVQDLWTTRYSEMKNMIIPKPSLEEQISIVHFLDYKLEKINRFIQKKKQLIKLLNEQKSAIINEFVTKGLDPNIKMKESGIDWLGQIPKHWKVRRLGVFGKFSKGGGISRAELTSEGVSAILYGDIYTKYQFKVVDIINKVSIDTTKNSVKIGYGDLLLTGSGETKEDIGKCIAFLSKKETYAGGDIIIFKQKVNNSLFLSYALSSSGAVYQKVLAAKGDIIVHIYGSKLKNIRLAIPPLSEQNQIVHHIEKEVNTINITISKLEKELILTEEYKNALITETITGKIDVRKYEIPKINKEGNYEGIEGKLKMLACT